MKREIGWTSCDLSMVNVTGAPIGSRSRLVSLHSTSYAKATAIAHAARPRANRRIVAPGLTSGGRDGDQLRLHDLRLPRAGVRRIHAALAHGHRVVERVVLLRLARAAQDLVEVLAYLPVDVDPLAARAHA